MEIKKSSWIDWCNKHVLICGGAGLIGSALAKRLVGYGAIVTIADNFSSGRMENLTGIANYTSPIDLRDYNKCRQEAMGVDVIFQLAANMGGIGYITKIGFDIMADSAQININMLRAFLESDAEKYFYSSSACIYPEHLQTSSKVIPLKESDAWPANPDQFYGIEKIFSEKLCEAFQKDYGNMNIRVARFHNVFGANYTSFDREKGKAPCHLILKVLDCPDGGEIEIWGNGKQTRSFLFIEDCIDGILKLLDSNCYEPVNIGSDRLVTIDELAKIIIGISGKKITLRHDLTKPIGVQGRNADLTMVKEKVGWQPKYTLEQGLERVYRWAEIHRQELII